MVESGKVVLRFYFDRNLCEAVMELGICELSCGRCELPEGELLLPFEISVVWSGSYLAFKI